MDHIQMEQMHWSIFHQSYKYCWMFIKMVYELMNLVRTNHHCCMLWCKVKYISYCLTSLNSEKILTILSSRPQDSLHCQPECLSHPFWRQLQCSYLRHQRIALNCKESQFSYGFFGNDLFYESNWKKFPVPQTWTGCPTYQETLLLFLELEI